jgi:hypothetical protein
MAATISSRFMVILSGQTLDSGGTAAVTLTNPGRTFTVVSVLATGSANAQCTVAKNSAAGAVVAGTTTLAAGDLNDFPCVLTKANLLFAATDNIFIANNTGNDLTRVVLVCESGTPEALTVT